jgi:dihydrofolate reductase
MLIYTAMTSLDGYVADEAGNFDWAEPDPEVHSFINDLERPIGTYLYGRRLYETMKGWETMETPDGSVTQEYAEIWRLAHKIVYSTTLESASTSKTRIERSFKRSDVLSLKERSQSDVSIGGPHLAAEALRSGLVDEVRLFVYPVVVGGGNSALPSGVRLTLNLIDERRFGSGVVYLRYQVQGRLLHS